ncbi:type 1 glutamine amidotransferase domain-containing protein [Rheinheimera maricola]|uniref:Type 1 glutamine amidotransferase domain-containing protein n=1 Tax=Rheinheimera maricola TaxID=2793282 RepID=A0ABS7XD05_9GAMM|nr:type 1 glutamine amidotransferase domain-containing protein [Rheinheimera maricola]MBZ9613236.1 type 1 glutamine amidotransferase domain-containing protein [Rheinheimera maricola]
MRLFTVLLCLLCVWCAVPAAAAQPVKKVLIVASNRVDMGDVEKHEARNDLFEFAPPYHVFVSHGYEVDFVSPQGGAVPFMRDPLGIASYTIKYENFQQKASNSLTPAQVKPEQYWAVFSGGGYGVMFDVAQNAEIQAIIASIYQAGGIVGVGGHGAASIANVKLSSGEFLVKSKKVASFPNSTELEKNWAKNGTLLPFLLESRLRDNGAIAQNKETLADKHDVVIDQRLVSTMFLPSAALVAKEMIILHQQQGN